MKSTSRLKDDPGASGGESIKDPRAVTSQLEGLLTYYIPTERERLGAVEVGAALEVVYTEAQFLLAPQLPVLDWMFKGKVHYCSL